MRWQKFNHKYSQAFSNLQLDYIQTAKNVIQNTISSQKQFLIARLLKKFALVLLEMYLYLFQAMFVIFN
jgi:hypothetical protein